jgi:hypothetical protein
VLALEVEEAAVVLVPLESVDLQLGHATRRAREEPASFQDLLQEQRVRVVEHRQVDLARREEALKLVDERSLPS